MIESKILLLLIVIVFLVGLHLILQFDVKPKVDQYLSILDKKETNDLYRIYTDMDPIAIENEINRWIDNYVHAYALHHFLTQDESYYIRSQDAEEMITTITRTAAIHLSGLYSFYIKMIRNVDRYDDVLVFLRDTVKARSLLYISEFNKPRK